jgi:aerobic-type carbon monoxide dehydrogenase small subunit (CoxS/CutS family)
MILMASQLLEENPQPTDEEIRHYMSGNICRCGAYPEIIEAVKTASRQMSS